MDKIKYIPLALFVLFSGKAIVLGGISYEASAILLILGAVAGFYEFKSQDKEISALKDRLNKQIETNEAMQKDIESIKNHMSALKLSNQFRSQKAL